METKLIEMLLYAAAIAVAPNVLVALCEAARRQLTLFRLR